MANGGWAIRLQRTRTTSRLLAVVLLALVLLVCCASARAVSITQFSATPPLHGPEGIAAGPDGNLWFTDAANEAIGRITPTGSITEYTATPPLNGPNGIAAGPDGNLWFADQAKKAIGRITPTGAITEFSGPPALSGPTTIAAGADGDLWFTDGQQIGRIFPSTGQIVEYSAKPPIGNAQAIAAGPDGNLWFTDSSNHEIGRIVPSTAAITELSASPALSEPNGIAAGPDGNLWFTDFGKVGKIDPSTQAITEFPVTSPTGPPAEWIATGPDGNLWFTVDDPFEKSTIDRIVPSSGAISPFSATPALKQPLGITSGPDGNLWFVDAAAEKVDRASTDAAAPTAGNLLRNPGFEDGVPAMSAAATAPVTGWATTPNFTGVRYGTAGGFLDMSASDLVGGGSTFGIGGPDNAQSKAIQQVDVSDQADAIDQGRANMTLAAALGGTDADTPTVTATFLSATSVALGGVTIGPVTSADRGGQPTLLPRSTGAAVPAATRAIRVKAIATRSSGSYNDASFDNLSLTLAITPAAGGGGSSGGGGSGGGPGGLFGGGGALAATVGKEVLSPAAFRAAPSGSSVVAARRQYGTTVTYNLNEAASVRFTVVQPRAGRKGRGGRCAKPGKANRRARKCTRLIAAPGSFTLGGQPGKNSFRFTGRLAGRKLSPGTYLLIATPTAGGTAGRSARASFRVVK